MIEPWASIISGAGVFVFIAAVWVVLLCNN